MKRNMYVAYYRVSTKRQGQSGLGLEAQRSAVRQHIGNCKDCLVDEYTEVETGTGKRNRVEIYKAIESAKQNDAVLVIAKLDRLARNVHFISTLQEQGVKFVCCDMPDATEMTIHIFAALAQWEAKRISTRIKEALHEKKKQGVKLGSPQNLTQEARLKGVSVLKKKAVDNERNRRAGAFVKSLRSQGKTLRDIANNLNASGFKSSTGKIFHPTSVMRLLAS